MPVASDSKNEKTWGRWIVTDSGDLRIGLFIDQTPRRNRKMKAALTLPNTR
jgi:hypothetical protein